MFRYVIAALPSLILCALLALSQKSPGFFYYEVNDDDVSLGCEQFFSHALTHMHLR